MKFLLTAINAKYIHSNPAVYSLYAYSEADYAQMMEIAEFTINQRTEDILAQIYRRKPDAIGLSCYIWNWNAVTELLAELPKVLPKADIWLGGPQVSYNAPQILEEFPAVKGIMIGEGEITFREILEKYRMQDAQDFSSVAGLCIRSGYTAQRDMTDLDAVPFFYRNMEVFRNRILYYESSRGCPYRCSYCLSSVDKKLRFRSIDLVKAELDFFLEKKVPQVKFVDRTFNCVHEHAMAIWQYLSEHDNGITNFHFEISADLITEEELALLKTLRPGQVQFEIGVQSANQKTLEAIRRKTDLGKLEYVVSEIRKSRNIHQHLDLIAGLPYEDYQSFADSFNRVYAMQPDQLQLGFLKVLSGTPIARQTEEFGIFYTERPPYEVLYTRWLSYGDVIRLKRIEEMVEVYYNSNQFVHTLARLVRAFDSPFAMFEALADEHEKKGYFLNSPSRAYRYEILLEFSEAYDSGKRQMYAELLTYDLFLRENMKTRPDFCRSLAGEDYRAFRHGFYHSKEQVEKYLPGLREYDARALLGMTHIEVFSRPVWEQCRGGEEDGQECGEVYVLFDYSRKDPLTKDAYTVCVGGYSSIV
ncbi:MAG: B12-binding domain-containing radical SAM protein [Lachnospiraceae bacterium]|nr:B12-binding domain-containing radical SAM protein [Lachnospiraceae bacterium]